jgi:hypothetical protein
VWINSTIVTDIMEKRDSADKPHPPSSPAPERNAVTTFLRDPKKEKTGELLKQRYCESMVGLQGSAYFVFGLPRVRRIVKDVNEDLGIPEKGSDQSESLDRLRETRNDTLQESTNLRGSRNDQLGETRNERLGSTKNERLGEPQSNPNVESGKNGLGETIDDRRKPPDNFWSSSRRQDDYKPNPLGQSGAYELSNTVREDLRESRKPRPEDSNLYSSRVLPDRREPTDDRNLYSSRLNNSVRDDLRESRKPRPEESNLYSSRVFPDRQEPGDDRNLYSSRIPVLPNQSPEELRKSRYNNPPPYAFGAPPDQQPTPREQYDDVQGWMPYGQSPKPPRSREDYPLPNPPPHREASGLYTGVIRR